MQHGRHLLRCRRIVRWALGLSVLASLAAGLEALLPAEPRWVLREPLRPIADAADDRVFVTAKFKQGEVFEEPCTGPLEIRAVADGKVLASLFADAAEIKSLDMVPFCPNTLLLGVQPHHGALWETHLLDLSSMTTRKLKFTLQPDMAFQAHHSTKSALTALRQFESPDKKSRRQELRLVDLATGEVIRRWRDGDEHIEPVFHERFLFYAHALSERWTVFCWDLQNHQVNTIEEGVHDVRVSDNKRFAVTIGEPREGRQRVKRWDLAEGKIVAEALMPAGKFNFSSDMQWAMIFPEPVVVGREREFWNLGAGQKIGLVPHGDKVEWWEVLAANERPLLATYDVEHGELRVSDAATLEPIWRRPWAEIAPPFGSTFIAHGTDRGTLIALDNVAQRIDLTSGESLWRLRLADARLRDGLFAHAFHRNGSLIVLAQYTEAEPPLFRVWLAKLGEWIQPDPIGGVVQMSIVIDPDAGKLLFQASHHTNDNFYRCRLSRDARTIFISYGEPGDRRVIECWDVPARKPWHWIVGIPLACGAGAWLLRRGWLRWRRRTSVTRSSQTNFSTASLFRGRR